MKSFIYLNRRVFVMINLNEGYVVELSPGTSVRRATDCAIEPDSFRLI